MVAATWASVEKLLTGKLSEQYCCSWDISLNLNACDSMTLYILSNPELLGKANFDAPIDVRPRMETKFTRAHLCV